MSTPDIRVRLSPEGLKEVIFALREVQKEGAKSARSAAGGVNVVGQAVRELKSLLPTLGLAAVAGGFIAIARQAAATAHETGKLQQTVGGTVQEISGLTLAFQENESNQATLEKALIRTANVIDQVKSGSAEAKEALGQIGLDPAAIAGQSSTRALETIATALADIPPQAGRAAAATKLFGKNLAGELLPALDAVGKQGIDAFIEKAQKMGVLIDDSLAQAAAAADDASDDIKLSLQGMATQFTAGFLPQIAGAMKGFSEAVQGEGGDAMRSFADKVGFFLRFIVFLFVQSGRFIGNVIASLIDGLTGLNDAIALTLQGNFSGALERLQETGRKIASNIREFNADFGAAQEQLATPLAPRADVKRTGTVGDPDSNEAKQASQARINAIKQRLAAELKLQQEHIKAQEQALQASYDQNLVSLADFFDQRRRLIEQSRAEEIRALQLERAAIAQESTGKNAPKDEAGKIKLRQELAAIDAQIQQRELQAQRDLAALEAERVKGLESLRQEQLGLANTLDELEGNRHAVFTRNLDEEIRKVRELGTRAGESAAAIEAQVQRLSDARNAAFAFAEAQKQGAAAFDAFERDAEQIRRDQQAGVITQFEGERRLVALERERLVLLKQLAEQLRIAAEATNDPDLIRQAQQYADSVKEVERSYISATDVVQQFKVGFAGGFEDGLTQLLRTTDEIHNLQDAFESLGDTVLQVLQDISAEIISKQLTKGLEGLLGIGGGGGGGGGSGGFLAAAAGFFGKLFGAKKGGQVKGFSRGGQIRGPGTGTSDSIPAIAGARGQPIRLSDEEFVVRAAAVRRPGALKFLRDFNELRAPVPLRRASGGLVGSATPLPAGADRRVGGQTVVNLSQTIQAPTQEIGRRTASQAASDAGTAVATATRRFK